MFLSIVKRQTHGSPGPGHDERNCPQQLYEHDPERNYAGRPVCRVGSNLIIHFHGDGTAARIL